MKLASGLIFVLSLCPFNGHFPGGFGLADTRMSPFWILLELRMTGDGGDNWSCHHQQTNAKLFTGRIPSCHPTNSVRALKGKEHWRENRCLLCAWY